jgi:FkbM family methyltransferase
MISEILHAALRSGVRGSWRVTRLAADHLPSLQFVPIETTGYPPVYVDLRMPGAIDMFANAPFSTPPWEFEQQVMMRRLIREGDVVFDIGANIGLHSVFFSTLVGPKGRVYAFEANSELYPVLRRTIAELGNCELLEFGLSDADVTGSLHVPENREMASLGNWTEMDVSQRPCTLRTLDGALASGLVTAPDFVKCDIEGAEILMLRGGRDLFASPGAPIVLAEANGMAARALGYSSAEIPQFLAALTEVDYTIFVEETPSRWCAPRSSRSCGSTSSPCRPRASIVAGARPERRHRDRRRGRGGR